MAVDTYVDVINYEEQGENKVSYLLIHSYDGEVNLHTFYSKLDVENFIENIFDDSESSYKPAINYIGLKEIGEIDELGFSMTDDDYEQHTILVLWNPTIATVTSHMTVTIE